ncbi:hypothetical protein XA68_15384 [Ophiocordyceps unilateralis]|uniref:Clr5 domain-containing protein n=1 Tax=Ophiocordyceps unilateralis TaxID=268505 RepID=A0A2A9P7M6_OPHUN|nr:hypothetical protein XA68_15384 [Ophiocordyceps unilateralis]
MPAPRRKPTENEWLGYKTAIQRLYLVEDVPLKELVGWVTELGLVVKLVPCLPVQQNLGRVCLTGKESQVIHNGKHLKSSTVGKDTNRHRDRPMLGQMVRGTPPGAEIAVCTPQPVPMEFEWPSSLRWFRFQKNLSYREPMTMASITSSLTNESWLGREKVKYHWKDTLAILL